MRISDWSSDVCSSDLFLANGLRLPAPTYGELRNCLLDHLEDHYVFYGEFTGVRSARKHIGWYLADMPEAQEFLPRINEISTTREQTRAIGQWFDRHPPNEPIMAKAAEPAVPVRHKTTP